MPAKTRGALSKRLGGGKGPVKGEPDENAHDNGEIDVKMEEMGEESRSDHRNGHLTDFERERLERIRKNQERMKMLNLDTMAAAVATPKPSKTVPTKKGVGRTRKRQATDALPPRRSSRLAGSAADGAHVVHESHGTIMVGSDGNAKEYNLLGRNKSEENSVPTERHSKKSIPFESLNAEKQDDVAFLKKLQMLGDLSNDMASPVTVRNKLKDDSEVSTRRKLPRRLSIGASIDQADGSCAQRKAFESATLAESDVAKVTKNSVTHLAFMPTSADLILAAADKKGNLGLWSVNEGMDNGNGAAAVNTAATVSFSEDSSVEVEGKESGKSSDFDGVLSCIPHNQYVSGLLWSGHRPELYTSSYDGSVRKLDVHTNCFSLAWGDEDMEYSAMGLSGETLIMGDNCGQLDLIDIRSNSRIIRKPVTVHNRKVNTIHVDPIAQHLIATSSTDSTVAMWDIRKLGTRATPMATASHNQTCQSAYFSPDGSQRLLTTSFDNSVRIWNGKKDLEQEVYVRHDNQTGRWVLPLRAIWTPLGDGAIIGNMRRFVDIFDASSGKLTSQLSSEWMTAIAARNCVHPMLPILASATASGRVHIFRGQG